MVIIPENNHDCVIIHPKAKPTPTPTPTISLTRSPTPSITSSVTAQPTATPTNTKTPTPTNTKTSSQTPTTTNTRTSTNTPTKTPTNTPTSTITTTPTNSLSNTLTATPTRSNTPTKTSKPTQTPTQTPTPTVTAGKSCDPICIAVESPYPRCQFGPISNCQVIERFTETINIPAGMTPPVYVTMIGGAYDLLMINGEVVEAGQYIDPTYGCYTGAGDYSFVLHDSSFTIGAGDTIGYCSGVDYVICFSQCIPPQIT